jgi:hypothetical protein
VGSGVDVLAELSAVQPFAWLATNWSSCSRTLRMRIGGGACRDLRLTDPRLSCPHRRCFSPSAVSV